MASLYTFRKIHRAVSFRIFGGILTNTALKCNARFRRAGLKLLVLNTAMFLGAEYKRHLAHMAQATVSFPR